MQSPNFDPRSPQNVVSIGAAAVQGGSRSRLLHEIDQAGGT